MTHGLKFADGLKAGMRVRTTEVYARITPRGFKGEGTIIAPSNGATGRVWIKLDGHKHAHQMHRNLFEVISL